MCASSHMLARSGAGIRTQIHKESDVTEQITFTLTDGRWRYNTWKAITHPVILASGLEQGRWDPSQPLLSSLLSPSHPCSCPASRATEHLTTDALSLHAQFLFLGLPFPPPQPPMCYCSFSVLYLHLDVTPFNALTVKELLKGFYFPPQTAWHPVLHRSFRDARLLSNWSAVISQGSFERIWKPGPSTPRPHTSGWAWVQIH